jgi:hypothetical protein
MDIILNHQAKLTGWAQYSDLLTTTGYIDFITHDKQHIHFPLQEQNGLWCYHTSTLNDYLTNHTIAEYKWAI